MALIFNQWTVNIHYGTGNLSKMGVNDSITLEKFSSLYSQSHVKWILYWAGPRSHLYIRSLSSKNYTGFPTNFKIILIKQHVIISEMFLATNKTVREFGQSHLLNITTSSSPLLPASWELEEQFRHQEPDFKVKSKLLGFSN